MHCYDLVYQSYFVLVVYYWVKILLKKVYTKFHVCYNGLSLVNCYQVEKWTEHFFFTPRGRYL